jgi:hypothetical protein
VVVGRLDVAFSRQGTVGVGEQRQQGRLVGYESSDVLGMFCHEGERVDRAAAAAEHVNGPDADPTTRVRA